MYLNASLKIRVTLTSSVCAELSILCRMLHPSKLSLLLNYPEWQTSKKSDLMIVEEKGKYAVEE